MTRPGGGGALTFEAWSQLPGKLIVLSGPSGAGKTTVVRRLAGRGDLRLRPSISATTRAPRPGEQHGIDYYFLARDEFEAMRDRGEFLEWAEVHGHYYGTPAAPVQELLANGICVALVIDVQGGVQVRDRVPGALLFWIEPPSAESLEARLRARGTDDDATIRRRLENARREAELARRHYPRELFITNADALVDEAVERLAALLKSHHCGG